MVKRSRGSVRPGQRRPITRRATAGGPAASPVAPVTPTVRPSTLTEAEAARAAEIEAAILAEERAASAAARGRRDRARVERTDRFRPGGTLAAEEAVEYAYVERDIRRIVVTAAVLIAALVALWLILEVAGLAPV